MLKFTSVLFDAIQREVVEFPALTRHGNTAGWRASRLVDRSACPGPAKPALTFGLVAMSARKLRPLSGSSTMRRLSITVPTVAFSVEMSDVTAVTSVVSVMPPISSVRVTRSVSSTCSSTLLCASLKPSSSALTIYAPGGIAGKEKAPTSLLCCGATGVSRDVLRGHSRAGKRSTRGIFYFAGDGAECLRVRGAPQGNTDGDGDDHLLLWTAPPAACIIPSPVGVNEKLCLTR